MEDRKENKKLIASSTQKFLKRFNYLLRKILRRPEIHKILLFFLLKIVVLPTQIYVVL